MPEDVRCAWDEDGNGLDDEMEEQLACCFVPEFRFDPDENALRADEPHMMFNAVASGDQVVLKWATIYRQDGGFANPDCNGSYAHEYDVQPIELVITLQPSSRGVLATLRSWSVSRVGSSDWVDAPCFREVEGARIKYPPEFSAGPTPLLSAPATHPVVFPSAGKHHEYCAAQGTSKYNFTGPGTCDDFARGTGPRRLPGVLYHAPRMELPGVFPATSSFALNACAGTQVQARRLASVDLAEVGLDGRSLFDTGPVGEVDLPAVVLAQGTAGRDIDHDGAADAVATTLHCEVENDEASQKLIERCFLGPDPAFRETYVAGGSGVYPGGPSASVFEAAWSDSSPTHWSAAGAAQLPRGGFYDADRDGRPNGEDFCPTVVGGGPAADTNRWGEDTNWGTSSNHVAGQFQRGDVCDPYPAPTLEAPQAAPSLACYGAARDVVQGSATAVLQAGLAKGVSVNGASVPDGVTGQTYRCACWTALGEPAPNCLDLQDSRCFRRDVPRPSPQLAQGRGYLPIQRPGCALDSVGFCGAFTLPTGQALVQQGPVSLTLPTVVTWGWLGEALSSGSASAPHFVAEDFATSRGFVESVVPFVAMTVADVASAPGRPQQAQSPFPDPEYTTGVDESVRAALFDVTSAPSKRLRAGFTEPFSLQAAHTVHVPAQYCVRPTLASVLERRCWVGCGDTPPWRHLDPVLLGKTGPTLAEVQIVRPLSARRARIELAGEAAPLAGRGLALVTVLARPGVSLGGALAGAVLDEPDLVAALDRGDGSTELARLTPVGRADDDVVYGLASIDEVPVALSPGARLLSDPGAGTAALFVPEQGIWGSTPELGWRAVPVEAQVVQRFGAAVTLVGSTLMIAVGEYELTPRDDLWAVSLSGGGCERVGSGLPSRRDALLVARPGERAGLVLAGGVDLAGHPHDDAYELARAASGPLGVTRVQGDSGASAALTPETATLEIDAQSGTLRLWRLDTAGELTPAAPTSRGWLSTDSAAPTASCPATSAHGGELCALSSLWSANPGVTTCDGASCSGSVRPVSASARVPGAAIDAVVTADSSLWVLRARSLERWTLGAAGSAVRVATVSLSASGLFLARGVRGILVGTEAGVALALPGGAGITVTPPLALCGRPLASASAGEDTWGVATTLGFAVVGTPPELAPAVLAYGTLAPAAGNTTRFQPASLGPAALVACRLVDRALGPVAFQALQRATSASSAADGRVYVSAPLALFELDVTDAAHPRGLRSLVPERPLDATRVDGIEERLYGAGALGPLVVDLRDGALARRGGHDVEAWVTRSDVTLATGLTVAARVTGTGVELAWGAP